jgi:hypothetical protein
MGLAGPLTDSPLLSTEDLQRPDRVADILDRVGFTVHSFGAIQIDILPTIRAADGQAREVTFCDHNCTTEVDGTPSGGHYNCPAALSINRSAGRPVLAPAELLIAGLARTIDGIRAARRTFIDDIFPSYVRDLRLPVAVASAMRDGIDTDHVQVNLFGGTPETHPGYFEIVDTLRKNSAEVHLTTTGRRIVQNSAFRESFLAMPPDILALGADDFESAADALALCTMPAARLRGLWRDTPWQHGQRKKAIEAVQIIRLKAEDQRFPPLLFNIVLHERNLPDILTLLDVLAEHAPGALLNPYPAQTGFLMQPGTLSGEQLAQLSDFVDVMLAQHRLLALGQGTRWTFVPRAYYWLMLRAALDAGTSTGARRDRIAGVGAWTCYGHRGAGRCVQIAAGPGTPTAEVAGGHLGCFWNTTTVTDSRQVWDMSAATIADWVLDGRQQLAAASPAPCSGCAFPRMSFDSVSLELGLGDAVRDAYLGSRRSFLGF